MAPFRDTDPPPTGGGHITIAMQKLIYSQKVQISSKQASQVTDAISMRRNEKITKIIGK